MQLDLKRKKDNVDLEITSDKFGTMLVFQGTTPTDHNKLVKALTEYVDMEPIDIYYNWKTVSVFLFDFGREAFDDDDIKEFKKYLGSLTSGRNNFTIVMDGHIEGKPNLNGMYIREDKKEKSITVGIKFMVLLLMKVIEAA